MRRRNMCVVAQLPDHTTCRIDEKHSRDFALFDYVKYSPYYDCDDDADDGDDG